MLFFLNVDMLLREKKQTKRFLISEIPPFLCIIPVIAVSVGHTFIKCSCDKALPVRIQILQTTGTRHEIY